MDRALSKQVIQKRRWKLILIMLSTIFVVVLAILFLRNTLGNSVDGQRIMTAVAELGPVEHTITASGEVVPEFEQVITSPIQADIQEVLLHIGDEVKPNIPIIRLDKSFALLEYEKLQPERELKENGLEKLRLDLQKNAFDLQITDSIQALDIRQLEAELEDAKRLQKIGGGTQENIALIDTRLRKARLEKRRLEYDLSIQKKQTETSLRELRIESDIQYNSIKSMQERLARAEVVATRSGILTWVNANLGTSVGEGEILARIADLSSFKVTGTCSNIHAELIRPGLPVIVRLANDQQTSGTIANINPTTENNILTFDVQLNERDHALLRPNMRVELFVVTAAKPEVIRVANGPAFKGQSTQPIFVISGDRAVKRIVEVGISSFDFVEIKSNIRQGDQVIISDMERYEHLSEIKID